MIQRLCVHMPLVTLSIFINLQHRVKFIQQPSDNFFTSDSIFEEEDPWAEIGESSEVEEESDVVPWSWASPGWDDNDEGAVSSLVAEFDTEFLTSEEEDEAERESAVLFLEEMLAEEEEKQRQEEEQEEILEMVLGKCLLLLHKITYYLKSPK